jgi:hypothetical protein
VLRTLSLAGWREGLAAAHGWRAAWTWAVVVVAALRLSLGLLMGLAWAVARPYMPPAVFDQLQLVVRPGYGPVFTRALEAWPRWDAMHYFALAQRGYFGVGQGDTVFYPLYPALLRALAPLLGGDYLVASLLVSTVATTAALACLYMLAESRYGSAAARWAVLALALYPTAFFLLAPFTESLFLALTLGAFLAADARRWWLAGLLAALASLARGPGLLTVPALAWVAWTQWRAAQPRPALRQGAYLAAALALPVGGGLAFLAWRAAAAFAPMGAILREYSGLEMVDPIRGLVYALRQFWEVHDLQTFLDVASAGAFLGLAVAMLRRPRWRVWPWVIYTCANLAFFLSKHSLTASSLQSLARYVLVLFPSFILLGDFLAGCSPRVRFACVLASSLGLVLLSALYAVGWFIG